MDYTIKYKGKTNLDYDLFWDATDFELGTGTPNVDQTDLAGVNGTLLDFNGSYKSFEQKFTFYATHRGMSAEDCKTKITQWLLKDIEYSPLVFSKDSEYYYEAVPNPNSVIKFPAYNKNFSKVEISFLIKPFKYRLDGQTGINIPKNNIVSLDNPEAWSSYPLLHVVSNEPVTITINNKEYKITNIDEEVYIDSQPEISMVYHDLGVQGSRNRNAIFPDHAFPTLDSGTNQISISGNYGGASIVPRWRALC